MDNNSNGKEVTVLTTLEQRKKHFDSLPKKIREKLTELGLNPHRTGETIRREFAVSFKKNG